MSNSSPRPDLNGLLLRQLGAGGVFLIVDGTKRLVPDVDTLRRLFIPNPTITDWDVTTIDTGPALSVGAVLVRADGVSNTYVVTNNESWFIPSNEVFDRYQFNRGNVVVVPAIVINYVPAGKPLAMPQLAVNA